MCAATRPFAPDGFRIYDWPLFSRTIRTLVSQYHDGRTSGIINGERSGQTIKRWTRTTAPTLKPWIPQKSYTSLSVHLLELQRHYRAVEGGFARSGRKGAEVERNKARQMRLGAWWIQKQIDKAVTGPASEQARDLYRQWVKRRLLQFDVIAETSLPSRFDVAAWEHRDAASYYEEAIDNRFHGLIATFRSDMSKRGHEGDRIELAVRRILEPIVDARLAGGIERLISSYSNRGRFSRELQAFVAQGIRRESFILQRKPFNRIEVPMELWNSFDAIDPDSSA